MLTIYFILGLIFLLWLDSEGGFNENEAFLNLATTGRIFVIAVILVFWLPILLFALYGKTD